jgi:hypothetical protein
VVFKLTRDRNGSYRETVLHSFKDGAEGMFPWAGTIRDCNGTLFGTTLYGGDLSCPGSNGVGCGVVFEMTP